MAHHHGCLVSPSSANSAYSRGRAARTLSALSLVPPLVMAVLAWKWFLPLPRHDYWDCVLACVDTWTTGFLRYCEFLWEPFVDQRMVGSKLALVAFAHLPLQSRYGCEIAFGFGMQLAGWLVLRRWISRLRALTPIARAVAVLLASVWLFGPLLGMRFQHHWYSTQYSLAVVPVLFGLEGLAAGRPGWGRLLAAIAAFALAALSHGTGALGLPAALAVLAVRRGLTRSMRVVGATALVGLLAVIVLQVPNRTSVDLPPLGASLMHPADALRFVLRCLGGPVSATGVGIVVASLSVLGATKLVRNGRWRSRRVQPWLAIVVWGGCVAVATFVHRSSLTARPIAVYYSFFAFVQVGAALLALAAIPKHAGRLGAVLVLLAAWIQVRGAPDALREMSERRAGVQLVDDLLDMPRVLGDEQLLSVFPRRGFLDNRELLRRYDLVPERFDVRRDPQVVASTPTSQQIEASGAAFALPVLAARCRAVRAVVNANGGVAARLVTGGKVLVSDRIECERASAITLPVPAVVGSDLRLEVVFRGPLPGSVARVEQILE